MPHWGIDCYATPQFYIGPLRGVEDAAPYERGLDKQWKGSGMRRQVCGPMTSIGPYR